MLCSHHRAILACPPSDGKQIDSQYEIYYVIKSRISYNFTCINSIEHSNVP